MHRFLFLFSVTLSNIVRLHTNNSCQIFWPFIFLFIFHIVTFMLFSKFFTDFSNDEKKMRKYCICKGFMTRGYVKYKENNFYVCISWGQMLKVKGKINVRWIEVHLHNAIKLWKKEIVWYDFLVLVLTPNLCQLWTQHKLITIEN